MPVSRYRAERSAVYVENHLPVKLENAAVYLYGQVVILGDLEPGQRIELENENLLVWPVGMTWLLADRVCGYPDRADDSNEEYMENIQKSGLGGYFADHYYSRYNPEVRLGGFIPSSYAGSAGIPADDQDGKTFYTEPVELSDGKGRGDLPLWSDGGAVCEYRNGRQLRNMPWSCTERIR